MDFRNGQIMTWWKQTGNSIFMDFDYKSSFRQRSLLNQNNYPHMPLCKCQLLYWSAWLLVSFVFPLFALCPLETRGRSSFKGGLYSERPGLVSSGGKWWWCLRWDSGKQDGNRANILSAVWPEALDAICKCLLVHASYTHTQAGGSFEGYLFLELQLPW